MISDVKKPLILDGAMGTELMRRGIELPLPLWSSMTNIEENETVVKIHNEYIEAGSNIITTNTFRTTPRTFKKAGYSDLDSIRLSKLSFNMAVKAANIARNDKNILIAGSIAPLEDCYVPSDFPGKEIAKIEFEFITKMVSNSDVNIMLFETMGNYKEIETILEVSKNIKMKKWLSIILKDRNHLLDNTKIEKVVKLASSARIDMLLINCTSTKIITSALPSLMKLWKGRWGVYPNAGESMPSKEGVFTSVISDNKFSKEISHYASLGASLVGSCCGSTPDTVRKISNIIYSV